MLLLVLGVHLSDQLMLRVPSSIGAWYASSGLGRPADTWPMHQHLCLSFHRLLTISWEKTFSWVHTCTHCSSDALVPPRALSFVCLTRQAAKLGEVPQRCCMHAQRHILGTSVPSGADPSPGTNPSASSAGRSLHPAVAPVEQS